MYRGSVHRVTWLSETRQRWKIAIFLAFLFPVFLQLIADAALSFGSERVNWVQGVPLSLTVVLFGSAAFLWITVSIRCDRCGARVAWILLKTQPAAAWFGSLINLTECPKCRPSAGLPPTACS